MSVLSSFPLTMPGEFCPGDVYFLDDRYETTSVSITPPVQPAADQPPVLPATDLPATLSGKSGGNARGDRLVSYDSSEDESDDGSSTDVDHKSLRSRSPSIVCLSSPNPSCQGPAGNTNKSLAVDRARPGYNCSKRKHDSQTSVFSNSEYEGNSTKRLRPDIFRAEESSRNATPPSRKLSDPPLPDPLKLIRSLSYPFDEYTLRSLRLAEDLAIATLAAENGSDEEDEGMVESSLVDNDVASESASLSYATCEELSIVEHSPSPPPAIRSARSSSASSRNTAIDIDARSYPAPRLSPSSSYASCEDFSVTEHLPSPPPVMRSVQSSSPSSRNTAINARSSLAPRLSPFNAMDGPSSRHRIDARSSPAPRLSPFNGMDQSSRRAEPTPRDRPRARRGTYGVPQD
jgi:hypothetical protein